MPFTLRTGLIMVAAAVLVLLGAVGYGAIGGLSLGTVTDADEDADDAPDPDDGLSEEPGSDPPADDPGGGEPDDDGTDDDPPADDPRGGGPDDDPPADDAPADDPDGGEPDDDGTDGDDDGDGDGDGEPQTPDSDDSDDPDDSDDSDDPDDSDDTNDSDDSDDTNDSDDPGPDEEEPSDSVLRPGARGDAVLEVQERLRDLGYWLGEPDGAYGELTKQAVYAFQAVNGLARDGIVGPAVRGALDDPRQPELQAGADRLEIDLGRQILVVVRDGRPEWIVHVSTGNGEHYTRADGSTGVARTPTGSFEILWTIDGLRRAPLGVLYRPAYFTRYGIAIHGAPSVPPWPASHGCVRVTNAAMDFLWGAGLVEPGQAVVVR